MREDLAEENLTSFFWSFYIYRYFSLGGDLEDLEVALGAPDEVKSRVLGGGSCSAIIKLLPDKSELFTAHDTWGPLSDMVRIYKRYELSYRTAVAGDREKTI